MEFPAFGGIGYRMVESETAQTEIDQVMFADDLFFPALSFPDQFRLRTEHAVHRGPSPFGCQHIFPVDRVDRPRIAVEVFAQIIVELERVAADRVAADLQNDLVASGSMDRAAGQQKLIALGARETVYILS